MKLSRIIFIFLIAIFANQVLFLPMVKNEKSVLVSSECEESAKEEKEAEEKDGEEKNFESLLNIHSPSLSLLETDRSIYENPYFKNSQFKEVFSPPPEA